MAVRAKLPDYLFKNLRKSLLKMVKSEDIRGSICLNSLDDRRKFVWFSGAIRFASFFFVWRNKTHGTIIKANIVLSSLVRQVTLSETAFAIERLRDVLPDIDVVFSID